MYKVSTTVQCPNLFCNNGNHFILLPHLYLDILSRRTRQLSQLILRGPFIMRALAILMSIFRSDFWILSFHSICIFKGIDYQRTILWLLPKCITLMTSYLFFNNIWPKIAELLTKHPIKIHEFHSTGMDCLNKTFFGIFLKFIMLCHKST